MWMISKLTGKATRSTDFSKRFIFRLGLNNLGLPSGPRYACRTNRDDELHCTLDVEVGQCTRFNTDSRGDSDLIHDLV